jgi:hypothetical protein
VFVAIPESPASEELAMVDRSEIEFVDGGNGLKGVDFKQLLGQMGKSISGSSMQAVGEPTYQRAIFGQDSWDETRIASKEMKEKIAKAGEVGGISVSAEHLGVVLDVSGSMSSYLPSLRAQINKHFPNAKYIEALGCSLWLPEGCNVAVAREFFGPSFLAFQSLLKQGCDAIYWFCDLQDGGNAAASRELKNLLKDQIPIYVRSLDRKADKYPGLDGVISLSGGTLRCGSLHEIMN